MKKIYLSLIVFFMFIPSVTYADGYKTLWKQVNEAKQKDLPQTQMKLLKQITSKAAAEKSYGNMLAAELSMASLNISVSPDSIDSEIERLLEKEEKAAKSNPILAAIYQVAISNLYKSLLYDDKKYEAESREYAAKAMKNPKLLAKYKASEYAPLVADGTDSRIFNNDLLHVIGMEVGDYKTLHDYYKSANNRDAACICALEMLKKGNRNFNTKAEINRYLTSLDSLSKEYGDLLTAGEIAIERLNTMSEHTIASAEENVNYINYALNKWGAWKRMDLLRNKYSELTNPQFLVDVEKDVVQPDKKIVININGIRNVKDIKMNVSLVKITAEKKYDLDSNADYVKLKPYIQRLDNLSQTKHYTGLPEYKIVTDSFEIEKLPIGVYLVEFSSDDIQTGTQRSLLYVSDLYVVSEALPNKNIRFAVLNATTGQPIPGANLRIKTDGRQGKQDKTTTIKTDDKGEAFFTYADYSPDYIYAWTEKDKCLPEFEYNGYYSYPSNERDGFRTNVFTDRSIYRPGQTVHASVIALKNINVTENTAVEGQSIKLTMYDANYKVVAEKDVKTDKYGTASTDFVLPTKGLTGNFNIVSNFGSSINAYIKVEEYKRPTFKVEFKKVNLNYNAGDTVTAKALAESYAGVPVQGAKVEYTVTRRRSYHWWRYVLDREDDQVVMSDNVVTDENGSFDVRIPMVLPGGNDNINFGKSHSYTFEVEAKVTDMAGETHEGYMNLPLNSKNTTFDCDMNKLIISDSLKTVTFIYKNKTNADIDAEVRYYIDNPADTYTARTNIPVELKLSKNTTASGKHVLMAFCGSDTLKHEFVVFSLKDTKPAMQTSDWFYISDNKFPRDGSPVHVQVGSSDSDTHILYNIFSGEKVIESGTMDLSNCLNNRKLYYKDEYGNGITITYAWVKNGKLYSHSERIERPMPNKRLALKWKTFRNRLVPGQKEEWTMSVTTPEGKPADAQLMAVLYDKSLEQIAEHNWYFNLPSTLYLPYARWNDIDFNNIYMHAYESIKLHNEVDLDFCHFDNNLLYIDYGIYLSGALYGSSVVRRAYTASANVNKSEAKSKSMDIAVEEAASSYKFSAPVIKKDEEIKVAETSRKDENPQLRENLSETAFFFPALNTDEKGNVNIKFTLPESITTWRFMGLAHDTKMNNGMLTDEVVAKKTVMIQPNMPRFVREGDNVQIAARIFNTSENKVSGKAKIMIIEPETEKTVYSEECRYEIEPNRSTNVSFDFNTEKLSGITPQQQSLLICRMIAEGNDYQDGEQHYLPVLSNKELVTNTIPFTQTQAGVKSIDITKLFPVKDKANKLTVEYTNNPSWLMIQALPTISNPYEDNAMSLAAAFYANSIARNILNKSPKIKTTIQQWQMEKGEETSLMSSLERNEELKLLVLEETPWVLEAENEAEQKQKLMSFFDESDIEYRLSSQLEKLNELQNADGSWSWWKGMEGSEYMTCEVMKTLVRLNSMIGKQNTTSSMLSKAFDYMGKAMIKRVQRMKENAKKGIKPSLFNNEIDYLYTCAVDGRSLPAKVKSANDYMLDILIKGDRDKNIYGKAIAAIIFAKNGRQKLASEYVQSIKEYTVYKEETGRYYDTPKAMYSWFDYKIPTQTAAIEALKAITPDDKQTIDEMQRWLLSSKRTQSWDTPINCINAVFAFMDNETDRLDVANGQQTVLKIDGNILEIPKATAGIGYVKTSITSDDMKTFTAEKNSDGVSWGALYAQFMQNTTDIDDATSGLKITREITNSNETFKVGDKIKVRITIKAERDYDFVQVTDKRAACLEPVNQLSGYNWGYYCSPKDYTTNYYFDRLAKGSHVIETEYYIDRAGIYQTGTCTVQCAYSPEFSARTKAQKLIVK